MLMEGVLRLGQRVPKQRVHAVLYSACSLVADQALCIRFTVALTLLFQPFIRQYKRLLRELFLMLGVDKNSNKAAKRLCTYYTSYSFLCPAPAAEKK